ncbi:MAG: hypothetical protein ACTHKK_11120, partial [Candidatus Nitrosocosmicus sp.]
MFSSADNFIDNNLKFLEFVNSFDETPYKVVRQEDATRLLHYYPHNNYTSYPSPSSMTKASISKSNSKTSNSVVFMIYAPINRYHILDLSSQR